MGCREETHTFQTDSIYLFMITITTVRNFCFFFMLQAPADKTHRGKKQSFTNSTGTQAICKTSTLPGKYSQHTQPLLKLVKTIMLKMQQICLLSNPTLDTKAAYRQNPAFNTAHTNQQHHYPTLTILDIRSNIMDPVSFRQTAKTIIPL